MKSFITNVLRQQDLGSVAVTPIVETQGVSSVPATFRLHLAEGSDDLGCHAP